jgi:hypothetical protein
MDNPAQSTEQPTLSLTTGSIGDDLPSNFTEFIANVQNRRETLYFDPPQSPGTPNSGNPNSENHDEIVSGFGRLDRVGNNLLEQVVNIKSKLDNSLMEHDSDLMSIGCSLQAIESALDPLHLIGLLRNALPTLLSPFLNQISEAIRLELDPIRDEILSLRAGKSCPCSFKCQNSSAPNLMDLPSSKTLAGACDSVFTAEEGANGVNVVKTSLSVPCLPRLTTSQLLLMKGPTVTVLRKGRLVVPRIPRRTTSVSRLSPCPTILLSRFPARGPMKRPLFYP